jgi:DNA invertase Pin-like site-specific DNA recombinase
VTKYGYARASMRNDACEGQVKALKAEGCQVIHRANFSVASRPQLVKLMQRIQSGDAVVVTKLDRLGRSTRELLELIEFIGSKGAHFKSIGDPLFDTKSPSGRLLRPLLVAICEFERAVISERTSAGRLRARERGVKFGRPPKMTLHQRAEASARLHSGDTLEDIARTYNVDPTTIGRLRDAE